MINLGLRCGQLMAERSNIQNMTILERTALWFRLERIGQEPERQTEPEPIIHQMPYGDYLNLKGDVANLRKTLISHIEKPKKESYIIKP